MKDCSICLTSKPEEAFYDHSSACKRCYNARGVRWQKENPDRVKVHRRRRNLKSKYGLTVEEYDALYEKQQGLCAVCDQAPERPRRMNVDHCHITHHVRGLLCDPCNLALGLLRDDMRRLDRVKRYLAAA